MDAKLKLINLSKVKCLSEEELKVVISQRKENYRKKLGAICSSKAVKRIAKSIAKREDSCEVCVYCDGVSGACRVPYSDMTMEDLDIDPCFEGVLRFLCENKESKAVDEAAEGKAVRETNDYVNYANRSANDGADTIKLLLEIIFDVAIEGNALSPAKLQQLKNMYYAVLDVLKVCHRAAQDNTE